MAKKVYAIKEGFNFSTNWKLNSRYLGRMSKIYKRS